jgi:ABC-2 type transport system permease protein
MNKISVIIQREYLTRVRKKSFIIMTILAPLLMAALILVPTFLVLNEDQEFKKIAVIEDGSDILSEAIPDTKEMDFVYLPGAKLDDLKQL